mmetsp:Transcript_54469/g.127203  ORF Transcript_54469/g.127203 Transcript_54469/m.127203 type:complete len:986 (+) Transcript_54469:68-3025(+)
MASISPRRPFTARSERPRQAHGEAFGTDRPASAGAYAQRRPFWVKACGGCVDPSVGKSSRISHPASARERPSSALATVSPREPVREPPLRVRPWSAAACLTPQRARPCEPTEFAATQASSTFASRPDAIERPETPGSQMTLESPLSARQMLTPSPEQPRPSSEAGLDFPLFNKAVGSLCRGVEPWSPTVWRQAYEETQTRSAVSALEPRRQLLRLVETSTADAIARGGYELPLQQGSVRPKRVDLSRSANPSVRWHGMETLRHEIEAAEVEREDLVKALQSSLGKSAKPAVACHHNPIDVAVRLGRLQQGGEAKTILTCAVVDFDASGCLSLKPAAMAPEILLRSNLSLFLDLANKEMKASRLSAKEHMRAVADPYILVCPNVEVFRSSLGEGCGFYDEPVRIHVLVYSLAQPKPMLQTLHGAHGKSFWYLNQHNHLELLERLLLLGLASNLWSLQDCEYHNIVMALPGEQPRDALVNSLKHWWKLLHGQYRSAFFCTSDIEEADARFISRLDMNLNGHLYKAEGAVLREKAGSWDAAVREARGFIEDLEERGKLRRRCTRRFGHLLRRLSKPQEASNAAAIIQVHRRWPSRGFLRMQSAVLGEQSAADTTAAAASLHRRAAMELLKSHRTSLLNKDFHHAGGEDSASTASLMSSANSRDSSPDAERNAEVDAGAAAETTPKTADHERNLTVQLIEDTKGQEAKATHRPSSARDSRMPSKSSMKTPAVLAVPSSSDNIEDARRKAEKRYHLAITQEVLKFWSPPESRQGSKPATSEHDASPAGRSEAGGSSPSRRFTVPPSFQGEQEQLREETDDALRRRSLNIEDAASASRQPPTSLEWLQTRVTKTRKQAESERGLKNAEVRNTFTVGSMGDFAVIAIGRFNEQRRESRTSLASEGIRETARRSLRQSPRRQGGGGGRRGGDNDSKKMADMVSQHAARDARRQSLQAREKAEISDALQQQVMKEAAVIEQMLQEARRGKRTQP